MTPIGARPPEADTRAMPGHWEGDLMVGAVGKSAIATLVDRSSRFVVLGHLGADRSADTVRDSLVATMTQLPGTLRRTLTWDQGAEMSEHRSFTTATGMGVYFCEAGSPWQRGSNENTNGLLRQYFPRGSDLRRHDPAELQKVAAQRPASEMPELGHTRRAHGCFTGIQDERRQTLFVHRQGRVLQPHRRLLDRFVNEDVTGGIDIEPCRRSPITHRDDCPLGQGQPISIS
ncbi:putative transposase [Nocardia nova SH22a]|uniref:Putative transposase n=1 Tax=Nocardia nova SH22a TaxID=1415166 RepID=W5TSM1_9NOCA|nr:putative transposase [Nocardia nova SH22a]